MNEMTHVSLAMMYFPRMEALDFRLFMHYMQALIKKEIYPSRMGKYSGEILFCGVLRHYVSQNIVAVTGNLRF